MQSDGATRRNLGLTRARSGGREGSLLAAIDRTVTGGGLGPQFGEEERANCPGPATPPPYGPAPAGGAPPSRPEGRPRASAHTAATRDGKGIVFVAHDGQVYPAGFLPLELGSVRDTPLAEIYRDHPTLKAIRSAEFTGKCGACEFADLCGGARARAYASSGDPLGEDTACPYVPPAVVDTTGALVAAGV